MLTEAEARDLLHLAADTIGVPDTATIPAPVVRRRTWPALAAAAAVLAVLGGVTAVTLDHGGPDPAIPPSPADVLDHDQIPSVFGYDATSARELLEGKGLVVTVRDVPTCAPADRALRTSPAVGSRFEPGDSVRLVVQNDTGTRCPPPSRPDVWPFLDFANGRGPAPEFAPEVTLTVNGVATTVTAAQAADPTSWPACEATLRDCPGSALDVIREQSALVQQVAGGWETPRLSVQGDAETQRIWIGIPTDGVFGAQWQVTLHWQPLNSRPTSLLTAVELTWQELSADPEDSTDGPTVRIPFVGQMNTVDARAVLESVGLSVLESQTGGDCRLVLEQQPAGGSEVPAGSVVNLLEDEANHFCPEKRPIGDRLQSWAHGATNPVAVGFSDQVRVYEGNQLVETLTATEAADPESWPAEITTVLDDAGALETLAEPTATCQALDGVPPLPEDLNDTNYLWGTLTLETSAPLTCGEHRSLQLWFVRPSTIGAVNLLVGRED